MELLVDKLAPTGSTPEFIVMGGMCVGWAALDG